MVKKVDVVFEFSIAHSKILFEHFFRSEIKAISKINIQTRLAKKELHKELVFSNRLVSLCLKNKYLNRRGRDVYDKAILGYTTSFFEKLLSSNVKLNGLFKLILQTNDNKWLLFLFDEFDIEKLKSQIKEALLLRRLYELGNIKFRKTIRTAYSLKSKKFYFRSIDGKWQVIDILFNAAQGHNKLILDNLKDKRSNKTEIWLHKDDLRKYVTHKNRWSLTVNGRTYIRIHPNDIALYSNVSLRNLEMAKKLYFEEHSSLWKHITVAEDESKIMDYYEYIITSIIFAYTAVEALINLCIPAGYKHLKLLKNNKTKRAIVKRHDKGHIERWYSLTEKFNEVLPQSMDFQPPNKTEKWWTWFKQLEQLRNKIIHLIELQSNRRYSELLEKEVFTKIESHKEAISFIGKNLKENKLYLLNKFPYGFGYDEVRPILIGDDIYND